MLDQLARGTRVINIDQSWLSETCFQRRRWRRRGQVNSMDEKQVNPRIAMLMAIDTAGSVYLSLTQTNTDHKVFCMFLTHLTKKLATEMPNWRDGCLFLCDGAKYQSCAESRRHMEHLGMRVCISAPYSYAAAPIELAFAWFKSTELNPEKAKTGKK